MTDRQTMNVSLPRTLQRFVQAQVASGRFRTASEVVREGLRLLQEAQHRQLVERWLVHGLTKGEATELPREVLDRARSRLDAAIEQGLSDARAGRTVDGPGSMRKIRSALRKRRRS